MAADLTVLSRAESPFHEDELVDCDLARLVTESASSLEAVARAKDVELRFSLPDGSVSMETSAVALDHIVINLVENAVKYSPSGGSVEVSLDRDEDGYVIAVTDNGPGVPLKYQQRIFERFYRVDKGRSREEGGTGLGSGSGMRSPRRTRPGASGAESERGPSRG